MSTDALDQMPDAELSEVFAVEVAGFIRLDCCLWDAVDCRASFCRERSDGIWITNEPLFATSADAVLPFLEKRDTLLDYAVNKIEPRSAWVISVYHAEGHADGEADTFARAACLALIKAKRAENKNHQ